MFATLDATAVEVTVGGQAVAAATMTAPTVATVALQHCGGLFIECSAACKKAYMVTQVQSGEARLPPPPSVPLRARKFSCLRGMLRGWLLTKFAHPGAGAACADPDCADPENCLADEEANCAGGEGACTADASSTTLPGQTSGAPRAATAVLVAAAASTLAALA